MRLFSRQRRRGDPPRRDLAGDAAAMRRTLVALQLEEERRRGEAVSVDLRSLARELLEGEVAAPTSDVLALVRRGTSANDFYARELAPPWEGLSEAQRAARLDGFVDLCAMLDAGGGGVPDEMRTIVRTKTLLLAFAFDETYGYLSQLARRELPA